MNCQSRTKGNPVITPPQNMSEQVSISIKLCNRTYRIKVAAENEAKVRQIMQQIGDKIADLKKNFPGRDYHDYMAMTLIDHITSAKEGDTPVSVDSTEIMQQLDAINQLLDE